MNKVILMGRLTRDPEVIYSQSANPIAVAKYGLAVRRQFKKEGEPDVDFINIVAFGKSGEFAEKYFQKGQMVAVTGRLQIGNWEDKDGVKRINVDVIAEEQHFAESKQSFESNGQGGTSKSTQGNGGDYKQVNERLTEEEDLPF